ncbi:hypothetical protein [Paenibacillus sp. R14(2021)]|uniref:hypothetical protein n=1 Tax=Paenibacillus sp. R14(2021) TaxID=2859228 RepID=UPI001C6131B7|nr:hypothetical protein [Paenibacillus sp. R14(2021)]
MLGTVFVLCVAAAVAYRELPRLLRQHQRKEAAVFLMMLLAGALFSEVAVTGQRTPSPLKLIEIIYGPLNQLLNRLLE